MAPVSITRNELLHALATASDAPSEARTVREMCAEHSIDERTLRKALQKLNDAQRLTLHKVQRTRIDGAVQQVPAYTIKPAP